ncbi:hypothetical protein PENTCL1PPCAC_27500 [Pristionchus entomophagus]|uniref:Uncharacterized protein n=1 Tax=Pristionchus entomophagus TaxID=358040 RepID=A0AAV5UEC7_9BILA|nr:hypothetical protein PENTCL1PPCAC_27500 [Pristionchus entomophagus]
MRKEKNHRRFHQYVCQTGPSYIRKDTIEYDSCDVYPIRKNGYSYTETRKMWEENMSPYDNSGVLREDPFGINDYAVNFSLNKKKRWTINEEIVEKIEEVQDPRKKVRVSASIHTQDVSKCGYFYEGTQRDLGCIEYHSVARDGTITHRNSEKGRTRLRSFSRPEPRPTRPHYGPRPLRYREKNNLHEDSDLPVEEKSRFQKAHVHYTTTHLTALPSMHNKASHRSLKYSYVPCGRDFKFARNPTMLEVIQSTRGNDRDENDVSGDEESDQDEVIDEEDLTEYDVIDEKKVDRSSLPTIVEDLSTLVVSNRKNIKNK